MSTKRDELATLIGSKLDGIFGTRDFGPATQGFALADAILSAGYVKADHDEYGMDHKRSDLEFTDEDGEPWTDEEDFRAYAEEYGDSMVMVRRSVTAWEPLV